MIRYLKKINSYKDLIFSLIVQEYKGRYRQSFFGWTWSLLQSLIQVVIFTVLFSIVAPINSDGIPYPVFMYSALIFWLFLNVSVISATSSLNNNSSLILSISIPRMFFPFASIIANIPSFIFSFVFLIIMLIVYKIKISLNMLFIIPVFVLQLMVIYAVTLLCSSLNVFYRDVRNGISTLLQLWFYSTPVVYSLNNLPEILRKIIIINPMSLIIEFYRMIIVYNQIPDFKLWFIASIQALIMIGFSIKVFSYFDDYVTDYI